MKDAISRSLKEHLSVMNHVESKFGLMETAVNEMIKTIHNGGRIFWMGNGGSAADSQHLAAELIGRFKRERRALPSIALTTDSSILTCLSNDYDYSIIFSRQLEALCKPGDVVIGISTSGNSKNVIEGIKTAKKIGAFTIGFAGNSGGDLAKLVDVDITIPSNVTARIQEAHIFIGHTICELVELAIAENETTQVAATA